MDVNTEMRPTKMAVVDLLRPCNVKCKVCYYRYETFDCPDPKKRQTWIKSLEKVKDELYQAKKRGCDRVDFTGGEPTIYPKMEEVLEYCKQLNITPRIITNGQAGESKMYSLIGSGCCLLYTSPSPRDLSTSRMPSSA